MHENRLGDPLSSKGSRYRITPVTHYHGILIPPGENPFKRPKNAPRKGPKYKYPKNKYLKNKPGLRRRPKPGSPAYQPQVKPQLPKNLMPLKYPQPYTPNIIPGGIRGPIGGFLRGVNILGALIPEPDITFLPTGTPASQWVFDAPGYSVIYCPWAGDPSQRAIDHIGVENISAQFNCGIFAFPDPSVLPGPVTGTSYELWGSYPNFPGEWASIVQVLDHGPPDGVPPLGPVTPEMFQTEAMTQVMPDNWGGVPVDTTPPVHAPPNAVPPPFGGHRNLTPTLGPPHFDRKPRKGDPERKGDVPQKWVRRLINAAANLTTESADLVNSFYRSLPRWAQDDRTGTLQGELQSVYNYLKKNPDDPGFILRLVKNIVSDQATDYVFGKIGQTGQRIVRNNPYWGSKTGLQSGSAYRRYSTDIRRIN